jgi:hypothetical protein
MMVAPTGWRQLPSSITASLQLFGRVAGSVTHPVCSRRESEFQRSRVAVSSARYAFCRISGNIASTARGTI